MRFGERIRQLRRAKGWRLRDLAEKVGVSHTHLSRVENERLNYGDYASDALIHRLAESLGGSEDELRILAMRVPEPIKRRVLQRPDVFLVLSNCDDATLDRVLSILGYGGRGRATKS